MKALVVFFTVFIICLFGWFGGKVRKKNIEPSKKLVLVNGLLARNKQAGEED